MSALIRAPATSVVATNPVSQMSARDEVDVFKTVAIIKLPTLIGSLGALSQELCLANTLKGVFIYSTQASVISVTGI